MKRTLGILAGIATLGAVVYISSQLWAQQQFGHNPGSVVIPRTRIALVNLRQVIKNYEKYKNFDKKFREQGKNYQDQIDNQKKQITARQDQLKKPTLDSALRDRYIKEIKTLEFEIQSIADDAKQKLAKQQFEELVMVYKDIKTAVERYARANDIELVMHYNDGINGDEYLPMFFQRKLTNGACMPMYTASGMDITGIIVANMNSNMASIGTPSYGNR